MKKERHGITLLLVGYSLAMLLIMVCTIFLMEKRLVKPTVEQPSNETVTEKYIYVYKEPIEVETDTLPEDHAWIVKEHEKRIAIFSEEGALLQVLDIYTNTLPTTDQRLLREGITVKNRSDLYALIEDYSE